jgi:hypothetical protein
MICMCYRLRVPDVAAQDLVSIGQPSLSCCGDCWNYSNWALFYLRLQCARLCNNMVAFPNNVYIQSLTTLSGRLRIQIKLKQNILLGTLFFFQHFIIAGEKGAVWEWRDGCKFEMILCWLRVGLIWFDFELSSNWTWNWFELEFESILVQTDLLE